MIQRLGFGEQSKTKQKKENSKMSTLKEKIADLREQEEKDHKQALVVIDWVSAHADRLAELNPEVYPRGFYKLYFSQLTHKQIIAVMNVVKAGKWDKSYNFDGTIDYRTCGVDGFLNVKIYGGSPPPNCKVVEEEVVEPSHFVPERTLIRKRIVCEGDTTPKEL